MRRDNPLNISAEQQASERATPVTPLDTAAAGYLEPHLTRLSPENRALLEDAATQFMTSFEVAKFARCLLIPKDGSKGKIIGQGESAITMVLPHSIPDVPPTIIKLIGKLNIPPENPNYAYEARSLSLNRDWMWENVQCLRDLGLSVPFHEEIFVAYGTQEGLPGQTIPRCFACHICPDLTEGGKFKVYEAHDVFGQNNPLPSDSQLLVSDLRSTFEQSVEKILALKEDPNYTVKIANHREKGGTERHSVEKMFFVRRDETTGAIDLVVGDLDHTTIRNRMRTLHFSSWVQDNKSNHFNVDRSEWPQAALEISPSLLTSHQFKLP